MQHYMLLSSQVPRQDATQPCCLRCSTSLRCLLSDGDGVDLPPICFPCRALWQEVVAELQAVRLAKERQEQEQRQAQVGRGASQRQQWPRERGDVCLACRRKMGHAWVISQPVRRRRSF